MSRIKQTARKSCVRTQPKQTLPPPTATTRAIAMAATPDLGASPQKDFRDELFELLNETVESKEFAVEVSRCFDNRFLSGITVDGLGILPLPVTPLVAGVVKALCEVAPHGKGLKTVVDLSVRRAFQIDSAKVTLSKALRGAVAEMVGECMRLMGVHGKVVPVLYKLLFYEVGGHFDWHRDTVRCSLTHHCAAPCPNTNWSLLLCRCASCLAF